MRKEELTFYPHLDPHKTSKNTWNLIYFFALVYTLLMFFCLFLFIRIFIFEFFLSKYSISLVFVRCYLELYDKQKLQLYALKKTVGSLKNKRNNFISIALNIIILYTFPYYCLIGVVFLFISWNNLIIIQMCCLMQARESYAGDISSYKHPNVLYISIVSLS